MKHTAQTKHTRVRHSMYTRQLHAPCRAETGQVHSPLAVHDHGELSTMLFLNNWPVDEREREGVAVCLHSSNNTRDGCDMVIRGCIFRFFLVSALSHLKPPRRPPCGRPLLCFRLHGSVWFRHRSHRHERWPVLCPCCCCCSCRRH